MLTKSETDKLVRRVIASFSESEGRHWCSTRFEALFVARMILQSLTGKPERVEIVSPDGKVDAYSLTGLQSCPPLRKTGDRPHASIPGSSRCNYLHSAFPKAKFLSDLQGDSFRLSGFSPIHKLPLG